MWCKTLLLSYFYVALGPLNCFSGGFHTVGALTICLNVFIPVFAVVCVCWSCCVGLLGSVKNIGDMWVVRAFIIFCCPLSFAIPIIVIVSTVHGFIFPPNYQLARQNSDSSTICQLLEAPAVTIVASYFFIFLLCLSVTVSCCYICKQKRKHNIPVCHCRSHTINV